MANPELIWNTYHQELTDYFNSKVNDYTLAEDLTQEVFVKLMEALPSIHNQDKVAHWLRKVAANTLKDHWKVSGKHFDEAEWEFKLCQEEPMLAVAEKCVHDMIDTLDPKYAIALKRSEIDGIKQAALAEEMDISLSGAKSRVQRGRQLLKEAIVACCKPQLNSRNELVTAECHNPDCSC